MIVAVNRKSFVSKNIFDQYEIEIVKRNNFLIVPKHLEIESYPSKKIEKISDFENSTATRLSSHYTDLELIEKSLQSLSREDNEYKKLNVNRHTERPSHFYDIEDIYNNMQRLCLEVLDPVVEICGFKPFIESCLKFRYEMNNVNQDSFFADEVKGNAVVFNFKNDTGDVNFNKALNYIENFSLFDKILIDKTLKKYERNTLMVSVNEKRRGSVEIVRRN